MQLWLYLHFPTLQLDSLFAEHGGQPIAIVDDKTHRIVQANSVALEQGILLDMGLGSAATLCSNLKVHPYDHQVEIKALQEIAQKLYLITADIMLSPPQGILLKATDMLTLYQGLESYWQVLTHSLDGLNMAYHFATGFSPLSAQLLAQAANNQLLHERSSILEQIKHQPISEADITQKHLELLQRLGVKTVGDLLAIPLPDIARRFDIELVNYIGKLTGQFKHVIDFYTPPEHFESDLELLFDINNVQWLEKPLAILLTRLEHFLRPRNRVAYELQLSLHLRDSPPNAITFTSACGYDKAAKWQTLCQLSLESLTLKSPVQGLTLETSRTGEMQATNSDLFSKRHEQQNELELVSYLQAKLGQIKYKKLLSAAILGLSTQHIYTTQLPCRLPYYP